MGDGYTGDVFRKAESTPYRQPPRRMSDLINWLMNRCGFSEHRMVGLRCGLFKEN